MSVYPSYLIQGSCKHNLKNDFRFIRELVTMSRDHKDLENQNTKQHGALYYAMLLIVGGLVTGASFFVINTVVNSYSATARTNRSNKNNSSDNETINPFSTFDNNNEEAATGELIRAARSEPTFVDYSNYTDTTTVLVNTTVPQTGCQNSAFNPNSGLAFLTYCPANAAVQGMMVYPNGTIYKPSFNLTVNPTGAPEYLPGVTYLYDSGNFQVTDVRYSAGLGGTGPLFRVFSSTGEPQAQETVLYQVSGASVCAWSQPLSLNGTAYYQIRGVATLCNAPSYTQSNIVIYPSVCFTEGNSVCQSAIYQAVSGGYYLGTSLAFTDSTHAMLGYGTYNAPPPPGNTGEPLQVYGMGFASASPSSSFQVFPGSTVHKNVKTLSLPNGNFLFAGLAQQSGGTYRATFISYSGITSSSPTAVTSETQFYNNGNSQTDISLGLIYANGQPLVQAYITETTSNGGSIINVATLNATTLTAPTDARGGVYQLPTSYRFVTGTSSQVLANLIPSTNLIRVTEQYSASSFAETITNIYTTRALLVSPSSTSTFTLGSTSTPISFPWVLAKTYYSTGTNYTISLTLTPTTPGAPTGSFTSYSSIAGTTFNSTPNSFTYNSTSLLELNNGRIYYLPFNAYAVVSANGTITSALTNVTVSWTVSSISSNTVVDTFNGNIALIGQEGAHAPTLWTNPAGLSLKQNIPYTLTSNDLNALGDPFSTDETTIFDISTTTPSSVVISNNGVPTTQFSRADLIAGNVAVLMTQCTTTFPTIYFTVIADGYGVSGSLPVTTFYGQATANTDLLLSGSACTLSSTLPCQLQVTYCGNSTNTFTGSIQSTGITLYALKFPGASTAFSSYITNGTGYFPFNSTLLNAGQIAAVASSSIYANATFYGYNALSYVVTLVTNGVSSSFQGSTTDGRTATAPTPSVTANAITVSQTTTTLGANNLAATFSQGGLDPSFVTFVMSNLNNCYFTLNGFQVTSFTQSEVGSGLVQLVVTGANPSYWVSAGYINSFTTAAAAIVTNNIPAPTTVAPSTAAPTTLVPTTPFPTTPIPTAAAATTTPPTEIPTAAVSSAPPTQTPPAATSSAPPTVPPTAAASSAPPTQTPTPATSSAPPTVPPTASSVPPTDATTSAPPTQTPPAATSAAPTVEATGSPTGTPTILPTAAPRAAPDISFNAFNVTALNQLLPYGISNIQAAAIYHSFDELVFYFSKIVGGVFYTGLVPTPVSMFNNVTAAITGLQIIQGLIQIKVLQDGFAYAITACTPYGLCSSPEDAAVSYYLATAAPTTPAPTSAPQEPLGTIILNGLINYASIWGPILGVLVALGTGLFYLWRRKDKRREALKVFSEMRAISSVSLRNTPNRYSLFLDNNRVAKILAKALADTGNFSVNPENENEIDAFQEFFDNFKLLFSAPGLPADKRIKNFDVAIIEILREQYPDEEPYNRLSLVLKVFVLHLMNGESLSANCELVTITPQLLNDRKRLAAAALYVTEKYIFNSAPHEARNSYEMNEMGAGVNSDSPHSSVGKAAGSSSKGSDGVPDTNSTTNLLGSQAPSRAGSNASNASAHTPGFRIDPPPPEYTAHQTETPTVSQPELLAPAHTDNVPKARKTAPKPPSDDATVEFGDSTLGFVRGKRAEVAARTEAAAFAAMKQEISVSPEPTVLAAPTGPTDLELILAKYTPGEGISNEDFVLLFSNDEIAALRRAHELSSHNKAPKPAVSRIKVGSSVTGNIRPAGDGTVVQQVTQASNNTIFNTVPNGLVRQPTTGSAPPPVAAKPRVGIVGARPGVRPTPPNTTSAARPAAW